MARILPCASTLRFLAQAHAINRRIIAASFNTRGPLKNVHPSIREVAVLQEATEMILSSMDVDTILHQILLIVRNYFGVAKCAVFLLDPISRELYCRAHNGYSDSFARDRRI